MDTTEQLHFHFSLSCTGEGNDNPLQCSCLENPRDGGASWAAVCGVAQSRTRLKWLSSRSKLQIFDDENQLIIEGCSYRAQKVNQKWKVNIKVFLAQLIINITPGTCNLFGKHFRTLSVTEWEYTVISYILRYVIIGQFSGSISLCFGSPTFLQLKIQVYQCLKSSHSSSLLSALFHYFDAWRCHAPG